MCATSASVAGMSVGELCSFAANRRFASVYFGILLDFSKLLKKEITCYD